MNRLLIHADPGARSGFVASWLLDQLDPKAFDSGRVFRGKFQKLHRINHKNEIESFQGFKIRIKPTLTMLDIHTVLFLRKNLQVQFPDFTKDEYCLETFSKLWFFSKEIFQWDRETDETVYDCVIPFESTFDRDAMISLYQQYNHRLPTQQQIQALLDNNLLNLIKLDRNHASTLVKEIMHREFLLGVDEQQRLWSVVHIYHNTPIDQLFDAIVNSIVPSNYEVSLNSEKEF